MLLHPFAEFAAVNGLLESRVQVTVNDVEGSPPSPQGDLPVEVIGEGSPRVLVPLGGGKDSLVAFSLLASQFAAAPASTDDGASKGTPKGTLTWLYVCDNIMGVKVSTPCLGPEYPSINHSTTRIRPGI